MIRFTTGFCTLGCVLMATDKHGVCAVLLGDSPEQLLPDLQQRFPEHALQDDEIGMAEGLHQLIEHLEDPARPLTLPLAPKGTAFQQRVWQALRDIPAGQRLSYSELAQCLGQPGATRAVASACAANPLAVLIPCHRVLRQDGNLGGYRWGLERKAALLAREATTSS